MSVDGTAEIVIPDRRRGSRIEPGSDDFEAAVADIARFDFARRSEDPLLSTRIAATCRRPRGPSR